MNGKQIAVLGLGRSGLAIAKAAKKRGAQVTVLDAKSADDPKLRQYTEQLEGIEFSSNWTSPVTPADFDQLVTSPGVPATAPILQMSQKNGVEVIGEIEFAYRIAEAPIVAITGTNGKSTTTVMTYLCLKAAGVNPILCGNIYGSGFEEVPLTEAADTATEDQVLVAEISSFQLEWIKDFRPKVAGITNISSDHIDRHGSLEAYAETKRRIFRNMGEGDVAVARICDPAVAPPAGVPTLWFGSAGSDAWIEDGVLHLMGEEFPLDNVRLGEKHNELNAQMAALMSLALLRFQDTRLNTLDIATGLADFRGLAHRMERIGSKNGVEVINNSMCTNPAAVVSCSQSIPGPQHLLIGGKDKNMDFAPLIAYLDSRSGESTRNAQTVGGPNPEADQLRTPDPRPRTLDPSTTAYFFGQSGAELKSRLKTDFPVFTTMEEAFQAATARAMEGDTILLAPGCASTDQFDDFRDRGDKFKFMAEEWLKS